MAAAPAPGADGAGAAGEEDAVPNARTIARCDVCLGEAKHFCADCRGQQYCSPACQRAAWPRHKRECPRVFARAHPRPTMSLEEALRVLVQAPWDSNEPPADKLDSAVAQMQGALQQLCAHLPVVLPTNRDAARYWSCPPYAFRVAERIFGVGQQLKCVRRYTQALQYHRAAIQCGERFRKGAMDNANVLLCIMNVQRDLTTCLDLLDRSGEAVPTLEKALSHCAQLQPSRDRDAAEAGVRLSFGTVCMRVGLFHKAAVLLRAALATFNQLGDEDGARKARDRLSSLLPLISPEPGDGDLAADISIETQDMALTENAQSLFSQGNIVEAELLARRALENPRAHQADWPSMLRRCSALGLLVAVLLDSRTTTRERMEEAVAHLSAMLALSRSPVPETLRLQALSFQASITLIRTHGELGRLDAARACLQEVLEQAVARPPRLPALELATLVIAACRTLAAAEGEFDSKESPHFRDAFALDFLRRVLPAVAPQTLQRAQHNATREVDVRPPPAVPRA